MNTKVISTTIEDEITFMVDPKVEFVSLVKHGANRTPFKVLKAEKTKEDSNMNKVVQSILVNNDLTDEDIAKALEGIDKRNKKEYSSFTAYPQVAMEKVNQDTISVVKHEEVEGIYFVLGDLAEGASESGTIMMNAKEAVDYATLDNLYTELYAMADVVGGAMRQENADAEFRKSTILKAIDNFKTFAEVVLENLSDGKLAKGIDPEDHPTLVVDIIKKEADKKTDDEPEDKKTDEPEDKKTDDEPEDQPQDSIDALATMFNTTLESFGNKLVESINGLSKEVKDSNKLTQDSLDKVSEGVDELKNTAIASKSEGDEVVDTKDEKGGIFTGLLFNK
jgi:hypothetical protein